MIDTHTHIHESSYPLDADGVLVEAQKLGVDQVVCIGTSLESSQAAIAFAEDRENVHATIGLHPSETPGHEFVDELAELSADKAVAIGECGLDYYYDRIDRAVQLSVFKKHLDLARSRSLPVVMHIRHTPDKWQEVFDEVWELFDSDPLPGVIHSFSATQKQVQQIVERGLYMGINGIATFMKSDEDLEMLRQLPLENIVLETDAPLLTPVPFRGTTNEPKHIHTIASFLADLRGEKLEDIAAQTTRNARTLFGI